MARPLAMLTDRVLGRGPFVFPYRRGTIGAMPTQFNPCAAHSLDLPDAA